MRALGCRQRLVVTALGVFGFGLVAARPARAQSAGDSAAAQALFEEARALLKAGRAGEACPKLEESQRLDPGSGTLLNLARCYEQMGRTASAWNKYLEAASSAAAVGNAAREKEARQRAAALRPRLPKLVITVAPEGKDTPGLVVTRDGERVGVAQWGVAIPADPGDHTIAASAPGRAPWQAVTAVTGVGTTVALTVPALAISTPEAPPTPAVTSTPALVAPPVVVAKEPASSGLGTRRTLALVAGGIGVVGVGVGTAFGLKSKSDHDEAVKYCDGSQCREARGVTAGEDAYSAGTVSTVGMVIGALGLAGGVALWVTAPKAAATEIAVGPGSLQVKGAW